MPHELSRPNSITRNMSNFACRQFILNRNYPLSIYESYFYGNRLIISDPAQFILECLNSCMPITFSSDGLMITRSPNSKSLTRFTDVQMIWINWSCLCHFASVLNVAKHCYRIKGLIDERIRYNPEGPLNHSIIKFN